MGHAVRAVLDKGCAGTEGWARGRIPLVDVLAPDVAASVGGVGDAGISDTCNSWRGGGECPTVPRRTTWHRRTFDAAARGGSVPESRCRCCRDSGMGAATNGARGTLVLGCRVSGGWSPVAMPESCVSDTVVVWWCLGCSEMVRPRDGAAIVGEGRHGGGAIVRELWGAVVVNPMCRGAFLVDGGAAIVPLFRGCSEIMMHFRDRSCQVSTSY